MVKTCVIKLQVIEGPKAHDQITRDTFHSFLVEVQVKLATHCIYMLCMRNSNLKIRIAGSSCHPQ